MSTQNIGQHYRLSQLSSDYRTYISDCSHGNCFFSWSMLKPLPFADIENGRFINLRRLKNTDSIFFISA